MLGAADVRDLCRVDRHGSQSAVDGEDVDRVDPTDVGHRVVFFGWDRVAAVVGVGLDSAQHQLQGVVDHALQVLCGHRVAGVRQQAGQLEANGFQVGLGDATQAQRGEVGQRSGAAAGGVEHAAHGVGQGLQLGHGVYARHRLAAHQFIEQSSMTGLVAIQHHTNAAVVVCRGVDGRVGVGQAAVGLGQDAQVGVHHVLQLGAAVDLGCSHWRAGQRTEHRLQVVGVYPGDGQTGEVDQQRGGAAAVGVGVGADKVQRVGGALAFQFCRLVQALGLGCQRLQRSDAGGCRAAQQRQQVAQVVSGDAGDTEVGKVLRCERRVRRAAAGVGGDGAGRSGHGVELVDGVDLGCGGIANGAVEQLLGGRSIGQAGGGAGAHRGVGGRIGVAVGCGVGRAAVGLGEDGIDSVHQRLDVCGVGHIVAGDGGTGQGAEDGA